MKISVTERKAEKTNIIAECLRKKYINSSCLVHPPGLLKLSITLNKHVFSLSASRSPAPELSAIHDKIMHGQINNQ